MTPPFAKLVAEAMGRRGLGLRAFCRQAEVDPSFFSKVLAGKRSPPAEEETLRRIAKLLGLNPAELVVAAGRIPREWEELRRNAGLFQDAHEMITSRGPRLKSSRPEGDMGQRVPAARRELAEELL